MASSIIHTVFILYICFFSSTFFVASIAVFREELTKGIAIKRTEKTTHLHFYFHDIVGGKNATTVKTAGPPDSSPYGFGSTVMMDDTLTEGPELSSKLVTRAQGIYAIGAQHDVSLLMVLNFALVEGKYNGSSLSILGRNPVYNDVREMPIVGGSGLFRFARGYALAHTIWFDVKTGDATVEYNVNVTHY